MKAKLKWWVRLLWCALYALLCAAEFVLGKLKDAVEERITGEKPDDDDEEDEDK